MSLPNCVYGKTCVVCIEYGVDTMSYLPLGSLRLLRLYMYLLFGDSSLFTVCLLFVCI